MGEGFFCWAGGGPEEGGLLKVCVHRYLGLDLVFGRNGKSCDAE